MQQTFLAPAKINTCLHVLGKRADGYHELAMLMQPISVFDRITLQVTPGTGVEVVCPGVDLPPGTDNIAARAVRLLLEHVGCSRAVRIIIEKEIPVAAGLGGGSSDAAAVLSGLNVLCRFNVDDLSLHRIAVRLGADVPFFLLGGAAWATGIGDLLEPVIEMPPVWYVLVNPGIAVSTAWVYGNLGLTSPGDVARLREFPKTTEALVRLLHNDLERVTLAHHPEVVEVRQALTDCGALGVLMSGSGPTVFGVFATEAAAHAAAGQLAVRGAWWVRVTRPLAQS
jgi:4-diphosphocytidyl-2-C-methyl-D-erythritol kinase